MDGAGSKPVQCNNSASLQSVTHSFKDGIMQASRNKYCRDIHKPTTDESTSSVKYNM
jgi:hypothetical protein